jgi:hypothetical protein
MYGKCRMRTEEKNGEIFRWKIRNSYYSELIFFWVQSFLWKKNYDEIWSNHFQVLYTPLPHASQKKNWAQFTDFTAVDLVISWNKWPEID